MDPRFRGDDTEWGVEIIEQNFLWHQLPVFRKDPRNLSLKQYSMAAQKTEESGVTRQTLRIKLNKA